MNKTEEITGPWYLYSVSSNSQKPILSKPITEITIEDNLETTFDRKDGKDSFKLEWIQPHDYYQKETEKGKYRIQVTTRYSNRPMLFGYATGPGDIMSSDKDSFIGFREKLVKPFLEYPISLPMHRWTFYYGPDHPHKEDWHIVIRQENATLTLYGGRQVHFKIKRDEEREPGRMLTMEATEPGPKEKNLWGWLLAVENENSLVFNCIFHHNYNEEAKPLGSPGDPRCANPGSGGNG
jgi:hypothetical protein